MTITKKCPNLQSVILADLEELKTTPNQINSCKTDNPYPIGRRAVWVLAVQGVASPAAAYKMEQYFLNEKTKNDEKETA